MLNLKMSLDGHVFTETIHFLDIMCKCEANDVISSQKIVDSDCENCGLCFYSIYTYSINKSINRSLQNVNYWQNESVLIIDKMNQC